MDLTATFGTARPLIGMVHLRALPGAPRFDGSLTEVIDRAVADAEALARGGIDGIMIENFGDAPFYPDTVPPETVAAMTRATVAVADAVSVPIGINVLRNDAAAAIGIASAAGGTYIRSNVHLGARVTDQGLIEGQAHEVIRTRDRVAPEVNLLADVAVKHSQPLSGSESLAATVRNHLERGCVDGLVVSGTATGAAPTDSLIDRVCELVAAHDQSVPVFVGSGVRQETAPELLPPADGAIVGTALKEGGTVTAPVAEARVRQLVQTVRQ